MVGTEQGLYARACILEAPVLRLLCTTDGGERRERELPLDPQLLAQEARAGSFWAYAAGVGYKLLVEHGEARVHWVGGRSGLLWVARGAGQACMTRCSCWTAATGLVVAVLLTLTSGHLSLLQAWAGCWWTTTAPPCP